MKESICGKSCSLCGDKAKFGCTGCLNTRGFANIASTKTCPIALCAYNKGTDCEACHACGIGYGCNTYKKKDNMSSERLARVMTRRNESKRLSTAFGLIIISVILTVLSAVLSVGIFPSEAKTVAKLADYGSNVLQFASLIMFFTHSNYYKKALYLWIAEIVLSVLTAVTGSLIVAIISVIATLLYTKALFEAHSDATVGIDRNIAMEWESLAKLYVTAYALTAASPLLVIVLALFGRLAVLALLAIVILLLVACIKYIILCVKTRNACDKYGKYAMN